MRIEKGGNKPWGSTKRASSVIGECTYGCMSVVYLFYFFLISIVSSHLYSNACTICASDGIVFHMIACR